MTTIKRIKKIIRPRFAWRRMGIGRSKFYEDYVKTGKLRLVRLGPRSTGVFEHELDELLDSLPAANEPEPRRVAPWQTRRKMHERADA
jgi:predicted DNA-binding transcriptional regulator AlpA